MPFAPALLVTLAILFGLLTGYHNSANIVSTPIASRAIAPRRALLMAAVGAFSGPFLFGTAVARAIGTGITSSEHVSLPVISAATSAALLWGLFTWWRGIPSSSSHALIGGIAGAVVVSSGLAAVDLNGLLRIALALFLSPIAGLAIGYAGMQITVFLARGSRPNINGLFKRAQWFSSFGLALSHGTNDAQKVMAIIVSGLVGAGLLPEFFVPNWVVLLSAAAIAIGTASGGWRLIRTLGYRIYKIRPVHGFVSQLSAALVILGASISGGPVSTTQVVSSSIMGAGAAERMSKVRWQVAYEMLVAWVLTVPISCALGALLYFPFNTLANQ